MKLLTYSEAADYLRVPVGTLRSMVSRRQIPHVRLSARVVRFDLADLDALIAARRVPAGTVAPDDIEQRAIERAAEMRRARAKK